jgi:outer membrane receptor protein involved in Fe transport
MLLSGNSGSAPDNIFFVDGDAGFGWKNLAAISVIFAVAVFSELAIADVAAFVAADINTLEVDEITVFGRGENLIGAAGAASEGAVAGRDLLVRPMLRAADLLEAVPGMIAAQHSGSGKANQYFLRGFNLDHGTDFTTYVDDVPWNLRTHGHGQGYLDLNGLIPEIVERIDYRKGPYRALSGDFSLAGSGHLTSIRRLAQPFVAVETGSYGWGRLAGGATTNLGDGELTLVGQYKTYDGPWQLPEDLQHESFGGNILNRRTMALGTFPFRVMVRPGIPLSKPRKACLEPMTAQTSIARSTPALTAEPSAGF